ncbi:hypothetical protein GA0115240_105815 [Streptomyces sp. DvalAA-14]|uniref:hypothetical protein n=1 Tax=unclassified Streptomyces TaxID=2593676 RepID=UPI00081B0D57|nr:MULTISPECIES: hypothetical protein [unclassified Streptomyces]MYS19164.1 hypothetical protein [Streptomyces sp. SID4948]SCD38149.1 hypothetical protein GA0115240_105815 [Streptomyces sp. DvalAA-14]
MSEGSYQPDRDMVLQHEPDPPLATVPVCVVETTTTVRTKALPNESAAGRCRIIDNSDWVQVGWPDPFRAFIELQADGAALRVAFQELSAQDAPQQPKIKDGGTRRITATCSVFVIADTVTPVSVSVWTENWATSG